MCLFLKSIARYYSLHSVTVKTILHFSPFVRMTVFLSPIWIYSGVLDEYLKYLMDRQRFVRLKKSALLIQQAIRVWIKRKHQKKIRALEITKSADIILAVTYVQAYIRGWISRSRFLGLLEVQHQCRAAIKIQAAWRSYIVRAFYLQKKSAAAIIQNHWRAWYLRRQFMRHVGAIRQIQACIRSVLNQVTYKRNKASATEIQRFIRGQIARNKFSGSYHSWVYLFVFHYIKACTQFEVDGVIFLLFTGALNSFCYLQVH